MAWLIILIPLLLVSLIALYFDYRGKRIGSDDMNIHHDDKYLSQGTQIHNAAERGRAAGRNHHNGGGGGVIN
ncbi:hypothetical protein [Fictibacillus phosphorivorans]|uniref:hypothetical protein n=1 Tax=Fictibacillus phosphorivorans TaxID=1221500 RepID=UPI0011A2BC3A|nr:hypothetical protein [Fictibacillus phosphorivorans]